MNPTPAAECARCASGPMGMGGHEMLALMPASRAAPAPIRFVLRCLDCGTRWHREFLAGSPIRWMRAAAASVPREDLPSES